MAYRRLPIAIGLTLIGVIAALYGVGSRVLLHGFVQIEQQSMQRDIRRVVDAIENEQRDLAGDLADYANWDATYAFASGKKPDYTVVDLTEATFTATNTDFVIVTNQANQIVYAVRYDSQTGRAELPASIQAQLLTFLSSLQVDSQGSGLLLADQPAIVSFQPIFTNSGAGPPAGRMIFGRFFNQHFIDQLNQLTNLSIALYPLEAPLPQAVEQAKASLSAKEIVVEPIDAKTIAGYSRLNNLYGQPQFIVQASFPRTIYQQGWLSLQYFAVSLSIVGILSGLVIWQLIRQSVSVLTERDRIQRALQQEMALRQADAKYREKAVELEQTLQELKQTQVQLIHSEKMSSLGQLVAGIAHEINNPVNFISGNIGYAQSYTQTLLKIISLYQQQGIPLSDLMQTEIAQLDLAFLQMDLLKVLNSIQVGAERIHELVLSLRNFSRLDEAAYKAVDLHQGIESTVLLLQNRLKLRGSKPEIQLIRRYGDLPLIECYPSQLNQVFMNLLSNAIDALEEIGGLESPDAIKVFPQIWIETAVLPNQQIQICIGDNGLPIPEAVQVHLFNPFFTTKEAGKGTGLGLAISYRIIVEKHQGRIYYNRQRTNGVEFVIEIPICQPTRTPPLAIAD